MLGRDVCNGHGRVYPRADGRSILGLDDRPASVKCHDLDCAGGFVDLLPSWRAWRPALREFLATTIGIGTVLKDRAGSQRSSAR